MSERPTFGPSRAELRRFLRVFLGRGPVVFGAVVVTVFLILAVLGPLIAPYDPYFQDLNNVLSNPSRVHLLGTDSLGRDTLSRLIYGARITLVVGVVAVGMGAVIGTALGLVAGFTGGMTNTVIMRLIDALMAVPPLMFALVLSAMLGGGVKNVMVAVGLSLLPAFARLMCGQALTVKENDYVLAAKAMGARKLFIMLRHVLPNSLSPLIVQVTMTMGGAILMEASLSFLGLGIKPPQAAWGAMVFDGYRYLTTHPVLSFAPGAAVMLVVFAFNMVGDGLRDALDPRLRGLL